MNDPHTGGVTITGTATEDQVLTANTTPGGHRWPAARRTTTGSATPRQNASSSTGEPHQANYTLSDADVGGMIRVVVSYTDDQGFAESPTSAGTAAIAGVNDALTGGGSITGDHGEPSPHR